MQYITILGSTGSIGKSTLDVVRHNSDKFKIFALTACQNVEEITKQCIEFKPEYVALSDESKALELQKILKSLPLETQVLAGSRAICDLACDPKVDMVMAAIVGAAGLVPTMAAVEKGKKILLANKESLVTAGELFLQSAKKYNAKILPVDSEHNAIFQALTKDCQEHIGFCDLAKNGVKSILLTGSGGPFLARDLKTFDSITPADALKHPNWSMGAKISIDSATMMNKGLEYIEARHLFNASADQMEIIIHPQSIIHSMVRYFDGSVIAQMGNPDMKTPIAYAMSYPDRIFANVQDLDFFKLKDLTFVDVDFARYPNLKLAIDAFNLGQVSTTSLNAANEISVEAFLSNKIGFTDIAKINEKVLDFSVAQMKNQDVHSIDDVLAVDKLARQKALEYIS